MSILKWLLVPENRIKLFGIGVLSVSLFLLSLRLGAFGKLPDVEQLQDIYSNLPSEIYSADSVLIGRYYVDNRRNITYKELSPWLVKALNVTVDEYRMHRQLTFTIIHHRHHSLIDDIKRWMLQQMIKKRYTKEEIVAMYFNVFDFVNNARGIESASRVYFNKKPKDLTIEEAALLVGMLHNPSYYNPRRFEQRAKDRRNTILRKLMENGDIPAMQFDTLKDKPIQLDFHPESVNNGIAPYFRMVLAEQLKQWPKEYKKPDGEEYNIYTDGLKIYTTINVRMQRYAEEAAAEHLARYQAYMDAQFKNGWKPWETKDGKYILEIACKYTERWEALKEQGLSKNEILDNFRTDKHKMKVFTYKGIKDTMLTPYDSIKYYKSFLQIGMMVTEPKTGYILAWVGGPDFNYFKYDHCNENTKRQTGSLFKPIPYAVAIENGWSPDSVASHGANIGNWAPKGGGTTLRQSLKASSGSGSMTAYISKSFGIASIIELSRRMGIISDLPPYSPLALGAADISLYEMMSAYSTFINSGNSIPPQFITQVTDKNGHVLIGAEGFGNKKEKKALNKETAATMLDMLRAPVNKGSTVAGLRNYFTYNVDVAGKTGTTNKNTDAWFIGFTPQLQAGVWIGCDDPMIHFLYTGTGQGSRAAMPAFGLFMQKVYSDTQLALNKNARFNITYTSKDNSADDEE